MEIPTINPHPLKARIKKLGLRYWQVSRLIGGHPSGPHVGNMLNGIYPFPEEVESKIEHIVNEFEQSQAAGK